MMAEPMLTVNRTIDTAMELGRRCLKMIPQLETPVARAASTYCICVNVSAWERTIRDVPATTLTARAIITTKVVKPNATVIAMTRTSPGKTSNVSDQPLRTGEIHCYSFLAKCM